MYQVFFVIIIALGGAAGWLWQQNQILEANNTILKGNVVQLEGAVEQQKEAMTAMKESFEQQAAALTNLQQRNSEINAEKDRYMAIFQRHNLDKLALMKPGMIQTRMNKATQKVFEEIENDSKDIAALNDSQPN
jgi:hypothetical protein